MKTDVEELLRDGMERFTAEVRAPAGLAQAAGRLRRRRLAIRAASVACGAAAVAAAVALIVVTGATAARTGSGPAQARTAAYVTRRVEDALARENLVFAARSAGTAGASVTWAYGARSRFEEFWPAADYRDRVVHGQRLWDFPPQLRGQPYLAMGTALAGGKLTYAYVTYFDRRYSLSPLRPAPGTPCSTSDRLAMGGPPVATAEITDWPGFIAVMLRCGAAAVTGHVRIGGVETTKITGTPATVRLPEGYAKTVGEQQARVRWVLYVDSRTYLPVRIYGSTQTFGGPGGSMLSTTVTDVQWLPATSANIARALVTIPPGFHRFSGPAADQ